MEFLPNHLKKYVVEQDQTKYTPVDNAVWRFILRQLKAYLSVHAHESYVNGLAKTGISIEKIPSIDDISMKLKEFGWRAVPVSGFIPPAAFMELQALGVLPIASAIRSLKHLTYTPAPDIVHEAAGHAPILSHPEFSAYLKQYAQVAKKAIISKEDIDLYKAIRTLSDLKENPHSTPAEIKETEDKLNQVSKSMSHVSEAAELARMNWWTAEYGLIGPLENPKIFGAGLLSSVGESRLCLSSKVKKIPLSADCVKYSYDITEPQPQLFVTPDFKHLGVVLEDFAKTMAFKKGGPEGIQKAIKAQSVNTVELDSGTQISGQVVEALTGDKNQIAYLKFQGPCQLSYKDKEIPGHNRKYHSQGFGTPLGPFKKFPDVPPENLTEDQWSSLGDTFEFTSGVIVKGKIKYRYIQDSKVLVLTLENAKAEFRGQVLFEPSWGLFDLAIGSKVVSVFGGAADRTAFGETDDFVVARVPEPQVLESDHLKHLLYSEIRRLREGKVSGTHLESSLTSLLEQLKAVDEWLPILEIYELVVTRLPQSSLKNAAEEELKRISKKYPETASTIQDGIALASQP